MCSHGSFNAYPKVINRIIANTIIQVVVNSSIQITPSYRIYIQPESLTDPELDNPSIFFHIEKKMFSCDPTSKNHISHQLKQFGNVQRCAPNTIYSHILENNYGRRYACISSLGLLSWYTHRLVREFPMPNDTYKHIGVPNIYLND